jgi:N-acetylglucosamine-6-sulfatase
LGRRAIALVLIAAIVAASGCDSGGDGAETTPRPEARGPNIVLITTDDQTLAQLDRRTMPRTVALLRDRGTEFADYIVTSPLCCPSRATMITGQYGHNDGVLANTAVTLSEPDNVLPAWLQRAGYRTAHVGKYLNGFAKLLDGPADVAAGWDDWYTQIEPQAYFDYEISDDGEAVSFGHDSTDYVTSVLTRRAVDLIHGYARDDQPFYLQLDYFAPHSGPAPGTRCDGAAFPQRARDLERFASTHPPHGPSVDEADVADKPSYIRDLPELQRRDRRRITDHYRCAVASLRAVDRGVATVVEALRATGELDRTAIIFTSDNGYFYGEHRIPNEKHFPYEEAIHVPLLVRLPSSVPAARRLRTVRVPTANIDLAPTILDLAGGEPCVAEDRCRLLDGRSLLPLLRRRAAPWPRRRALVVELDLPGNEEPYARVCQYAGVRVPGFFYVEDATAAPPGGDCEPVDDTELYDLRREPAELRNLAGSGDPRIQRIERRLAARLARLRDCAGIHGHLGDEAKPPCE